MKKLLLFCIAAGIVGVASAQKVYFLYLQTDDQSPFYVRMSDKIYSSAVSGFLILPNLTDSTYTINVGFAKSTKPETRFAVTINQNDKGYLIKNFDDGLSLFDIQNLNIIKASNTNNNNTVFETKSDKFSSVLSKAADDPSLLKVAVTKKEEPKPKPETVEPLVQAEETKPLDNKAKDTIIKSTATADLKTDSKAETPKTDTQPVVITNTVIEETRQPILKSDSSIKATEPIDYKRSLVTRHSESSTTEGLGVVYFDKAEGKTDTVRILIPPSKIKLIQDGETTVNAPESQKKSDTSIETKQPSTESANETKNPVVENKVVSPTSCEVVASDKDFMKVRKNMAAKSSDEDMIAEAKKTFKTKCYSTEQIRYLSTLFLTSAAKYQFFDAAFLHVSDKQNFSSLQSEIKDDYYLKRFKALVGE